MRVLMSLATLPERDVRRTAIGPNGPTFNDGKADGKADGHAQVLVVEFDDAYTEFVEGFEQLPSESQMLALQAVDTQLSAMVGAKDAALWTARARHEEPAWTALRELVADVIEAFSWPEASGGALTDRAL